MDGSQASVEREAPHQSQTTELINKNVRRFRLGQHCYWNRPIKTIGSLEEAQDKLAEDGSVLVSSLDKKTTSGRSIWRSDGENC